jgi:hypothetical protein
MTSTSSKKPTANGLVLIEANHFTIVGGKGKKGHYEVCVTNNLKL